MIEYWIAWILAVLAGLGVCLGLYFLLRPWPKIKYLGPMLVATWMLLPWKFQDDPIQIAPAFIVLVFRGWFEVDSDPGIVAMGLALASITVLAIYALTTSVKSILRRATWKSRRLIE